MIFQTRNVRWYKLPLLVAFIGCAAVLTVPGLVWNALRRELCGQP